ncbi:MAG: adenylate/guanylate cyclase domain-containing protein [Thermoplasmata archaeon]
MTDSARRLAAIMFTDMVGYSALVQADEAAALAVLDRHNRLLRPLFARFHGREVKTVGDAFLVAFGSALEATLCALEIQRSLHEYNAAAPDDWKIRIRIGVHVGDVIETNGDVLGDAVNIASRIEALAEPEGICLTQQVVDQVQNKIPNGLAKLAPVALKNIRTPVGAYRVVPAWEGSRTESSEHPPRTGRHLAVLPLANISPDPGDGYFAEGLTEELISVLSHVRGLSVIARSSVAPYKLAPKSIAQVGAELGVDTVLEGSVRKSGNRIRITLQLIDVATQGHVWASSYNREVGDVFAVQTDIAERTAEVLLLELVRADSPATKRRPTANPAAYDLYLHGLVAASDLDKNGSEEAIRCFEEATRLDPTFAEAYAAWANLYVIAAGDSLPMRDVMPPARELARRALDLDAESSDAHAALGNIALQFDHDWGLAEAEFARAIELNPSNVSAHYFLGLLLGSQERFEEAKESVRRAIRLDPGGRWPTTLIWMELESGNFEVAIADATRRRDDDPTSTSRHTFLGFCYLGAGRLADARAEADTPTIGANDGERFDRALLQVLVGEPGAAREVAAEAERGESKSYTSGTHLAMLYAALGERNRALDLLEREFREGDRVLWLHYRGVMYDSIRDDPRFIALLHQYGVPSHPIRRGAAPAP